MTGAEGREACTRGKEQGGSCGSRALTADTHKHKRPGINSPALLVVSVRRVLMELRCSHGAAGDEEDETLAMLECVISSGLLSRCICSFVCVFPMRRLPVTKGYDTRGAAAAEAEHVLIGLLRDLPIPGMF